MQPLDVLEKVPAPHTHHYKDGYTVTGNQCHSVALSGTQWHPEAISQRHSRATQRQTTPVIKWQSVALSGAQWHSVALSGTQWHSVAITGNQWQSVAISGKPHL